MNDATKNAATGAPAGTSKAKTTAKPEATGAKKSAKGPRTTGPSSRQPTEHAPSALDAAARVLGETKKPMHCKDLVEVMLKRKYWSTKGKTPSATLYSALLREIQSKGKDARFKKVDRGQFALSGK